jgi:DNA-binding transcriptional MerR regulator
VLLIRRIRQLLYEEGFTISGARQRLEHDAEVPTETAPAPVADGLDVTKLRTEITAILKILG